MLGKCVLMVRRYAVRNVPRGEILYPGVRSEQVCALGTAAMPGVYALGFSSASAPQTPQRLWACLESRVSSARLRVQSEAQV